MTPDAILDIGLLAVIAVGAAWLLVRLRRYGGLKAALFGAPIKATMGEAVSDAGLRRVTVRVHLLSGGPDRAIGLELTWRMFGGHEMRPVTLSLAEARKLAALLQSATGAG